MSTKRCEISCRRSTGWAAVVPGCGSARLGAANMADASRTCQDERDHVVVFDRCEALSDIRRRVSCEFGDRVFLDLGIRLTALRLVWPTGVVPSCDCFRHSPSYLSREWAISRGGSLTGRETIRLYAEEIRNPARMALLLSKVHRFAEERGTTASQ